MSIRFLSILEKGRLAGFLILSTTLPLVFVQQLLAQTPNLSVGAFSATAGQSIDLPVSLAPGSALVSGIQFDLSFPGSLFYVSTSTGSSGAAAGKSAQGNGISGGARVLVFGVNQYVIGSGPVAVVRLRVADDTSPGTISVTIGSIVASDGDGSAVTVTGNAGSVVVTQSGSDTTVTNSGAVLASLSCPRLNTGNPDEQNPQDDAQYTGVAIANLDDNTASLKFTAYDASGTEVSGTNISNPVSRTLKPGEQLPVVDTELFGPGLSQNSGGWVKVESTAGRITGFFLMFNSRLTILDGAALGQAPMSSFVLPEIEDQGFTRIHITNPGKDPATVTLQIVQSDGTVRSSVTRDIAGNGVLAGDLFSDLFPEITPVRSDYLRVSSSGALSAHELLGKTDMFIEALTGQDPAQGGRTLYSPQYVLGGGWLSSLSIVNLDSSEGSLTLRFMNDNAVQVGESKVVPIPPQGKIHIDDRNFFGDVGEALVQGYVEIQSDGVRLTGDVVFGDVGRGVFSSALPLVGTLQNNVVFSHVASNESYFTGIAILNPNDTPATATVDVYAADGSLEFRTIEVIPARGRRSRLLTQYFPTMARLNRTSGYVRVTVDKEVASFALFGTHDLSVLSAIPGVVPR